MKHVYKGFILVLLMGVIFSAVGCKATQPGATGDLDTETELQETVLELVKDGESIYFTMEQLRSLPAVEGLAGIMSSTGKITAPVMYKGVLVSTLLEELGGMTEEHSVEIIAEDGYSITYSPAQIFDGQYITYDVSSGDEMQTIGTLQSIIAYEREGEPLNPEMDGMLRYVIIGESNLQVTDGHWAVKYVNKIVLKNAIEDWVVDFIGAIDEPMDRATFESGAAEGCHLRTWTDEDGRVWSGIPLFYLVGRVDDEVKHGDDSYRDDLAKAGYSIDVIAADGYTVTLDSLHVMRNDNIIVAYLVDGQPLEEGDFPLRLVGSELTKKEMVGAIASVILHLDEATSEDASSAEFLGEVPAVIGPADASVTITGKVDADKTVSMDDLLGLAVANLNVEHPKNGPTDVTGVRLTDVLALVTIPADATTVSLIASDGYSADVPLADVLTCESCLLGWDEEMLRSYMPGFESNTWVKNLATIEIK